MARGRKPKPPGLRLVQGDTRNEGRRKHESRAKTAVDAGGGKTRPPKLRGSALAYWKHLQRVLEPRGDLTPRDRNAMARYCELLATWWDLDAQIHAIGYLVKTAMGDVKANPLLTQRNVIAGKLLQLESEFGLTPAARVRLKASEAPAPQKSPAELMRERALQQRRGGAPRGSTDGA